MLTNKQTKKVKKVTRKRKRKHCLLNYVFNLFDSVPVFVLSDTSHIQHELLRVFYIIFLYSWTHWDHIECFIFNGIAQHDFSNDSGMGSLIFHIPCGYVGIFSNVTPRGWATSACHGWEARRILSLAGPTRIFNISYKNKGFFAACQLLGHFWLASAKTSLNDVFHRIQLIELSLFYCIPDQIDAYSMSGHWPSLYVVSLAVCWHFGTV